MNDPSDEAGKVLAKVPYFSGLEPQSLAAIARVTYPRDYDPGQLIILEGEPAAGLYLVQSGWLKVSKIAVDGREQILQFLESGEVFNAVSVFTGTPNPASVTALETARVWMIAREELLKLLDADPRFARRIIQDLAGRVMHLIALVEDLSLRTVEARLARQLLEQAVDGKVYRQRWATQTEMAARLGTVPDVVSRTLRKLAEQGLIEISRNGVTILNPRQLEAIARIDP